MTIVRTKTKASGGITADEKARMAEHAKKWIQIAMRTDPIEPEKIVPAINGLYAAARLNEPRVVIVPSPMVMAFAYGASAAIWYARKTATNEAIRAATRDATRNATYAATEVATYAATTAATRTATRAAVRDATHNATRDATRDATADATDVATRVATRDATLAATRIATRDATADATDAATSAATYVATDAATRDATDVATRDATLAATRIATRDATRKATSAATYVATDAATRDATEVATSVATYNATHEATDATPGKDAEKREAAACRALAGHLGISCAAKWDSAYQGGNMWAGYDSYLTACRDILGLELPSHAAYQFWEQAAVHGGFRVMHDEFCIVSDFPELIRVDSENRPHCENGPSHRWRDGWSLYHWHGVSVPAEWIEDRASLTPEIALTWENIEQRRAACEILGWGSILAALDARVIDEDGDPEIGTLVDVDLPGSGRERFLRVLCGTGREFALPVPPGMKTALEAQAWTWGLDSASFIRPEIRT